MQIKNLKNIEKTHSKEILSSVPSTVVAINQSPIEILFDQSRKIYSYSTLLEGFRPAEIN